MGLTHEPNACTRLEFNPRAPALKLRTAAVSERFSQSAGKPIDVLASWQVLNVPLALRTPEAVTVADPERTQLRRWLQRYAPVAVTAVSVVNFRRSPVASKYQRRDARRRAGKKYWQTISAQNMACSARDAPRSSPESGLCGCWLR